MMDVGRALHRLASVIALGMILSTGFGSVVQASGRSFAGMPTEGASGLIRMGARHYDAYTARFLQTDPLGAATDQLYAYGANNPYLYWDPTGFAPQSISGFGVDAGLDALFLTELTEVSSAFAVPGALPLLAHAASSAGVELFAAIVDEQFALRFQIDLQLLRTAQLDEAMSLHAALRNPTQENMARLRVAMAAAHDPVFRRDLLWDTVPIEQRERLSKLTRLSNKLRKPVEFLASEFGSSRPGKALATFGSRASRLVGRSSPYLTAYDVARFGYASRNRAPSESIAQTVYDARDAILDPLGDAQ